MHGLRVDTSPIELCRSLPAEAGRMESIVEAVALRGLTGPLSPPRIRFKRRSNVLRAPIPAEVIAFPLSPGASFGAGAHVIADGGHTAT